MYGWRARVGTIVPSTNAVNEVEFARYLPEGVSLHVSRMRRVGGGDLQTLREMEAHKEDCAELLGTANVDVVAYSCTAAGMLEGPEYELELEEELGEIAGAPVVSMSAALRRAAERLDLESIAVATPYIEEVNELEEEHFGELGFDVVSIEGLGVGRDDPTEKGRLMPSDAYGIAQRADRPEADGLLISCADFRTFEVVEALEADLGKPVVTSNSATLWNALEVIDVDYTDIPLGTLFAT